MKENICTAAGIIGGFFAALLGGWDSALITLIIFMAIDFTTGLIAASMGRSKHSKTGRLSSKAGWVGLAKKENVSAIMRAFLEKVESAGYFTGLYGSASSLTTHTADDIKSRYTIWLAHWVNQTNYSSAYAIWQYSSKGKVAGINGNVDLDICYKDFLTVIKNKGLNGWVKSSTPAPDVLDTATVTITIGNDTYKGTLVKA